MGKVEEFGAVLGTKYGQRKANYKKNLAIR